MTTHEPRPPEKKLATRREKMGRRLSAVWENVVFAFEAMRERAWLSFLTILGVFIGVFIIIAVASVLNGFRQSVIDSIEQWGTNNVYVSRMPMVMMSRPPAEVRKREFFTAKDAQAIREECPDVATVCVLAQLPAESVKYRDKEFVGAYLEGAPAVARDVINFDVEYGRFFTEVEDLQHARVAVVGWNIADTLFPNVSPLAKRITLEGRRLRVIGVLAKAKGNVFGGENPDDSVVYVPMRVFHEIHPWLKDLFIAAVAKRGRLAQAKEQIEETLRRRRHVPWDAENDFDIGTADSIIVQFDKIVFTTLAVMFSLSTVAFLVGGVGVMNIMFASVKQRTREIGIRRALGARRGDITWQFLIEAMVMTGVGGILGACIGEVCMRAIAALLPMIPCTTPMWARLFAFFGSITVGLVFGLLPAMRAARLDPIKALRYE